MPWEQALVLARGKAQRVKGEISGQEEEQQGVQTEALRDVRLRAGQEPNVSWGNEDATCSLWEEPSPSQWTASLLIHAIE